MLGDRRRAQPGLGPAALKDQTGEYSTGGNGEYSSGGDTLEQAAADAAAVAAGGRNVGSSTARAVESVESLFGRTIQGPQVSYLTGAQNGRLPEQIGLQALEQQTGRQFTPLQNASSHGADGVYIDTSSQTIYVVEVKSSQNGVGQAAKAEGDPAAKLNEWASRSSRETPPWGAQPETNRALAAQIETSIRSGFTVKGIQVQVGVPVPGSTGGTQIKIDSWTKP